MSVVFNRRFRLLILPAASTPGLFSLAEEAPAAKTTTTGTAATAATATASCFHYYHYYQHHYRYHCHCHLPRLPHSLAAASALAVREFEAGCPSGSDRPGGNSKSKLCPSVFSFQKLDHTGSVSSAPISPCDGCRWRRLSVKGEPLQGFFSKCGDNVAAARFH